MNAILKLKCENYKYHLPAVKGKINENGRGKETEENERKTWGKSSMHF